MENEELDLRCPCMPQCPNYGKCRICIATHAKFYTPPHCVKRMMEEMRKNHLHPSNPHIKKTLSERVKEYFEKNAEARLREASEELKITQWQLLDAMESTVSIPVSDFPLVYEKFALLDKVILHVETDGALLQVETKLPEIKTMNDVSVLKTAETSLTALLFHKNIYAVFLVREKLHGRESLSLAVIGEDEKNAISFYLAHNGNGGIEEKSKAIFEALWQTYQK